MAKSKNRRRTKKSKYRNNYMKGGAEGGTKRQANTKEQLEKLYADFKFVIKLTFFLF